MNASELQWKSKFLLLLNSASTYKVIRLKFRQQATKRYDNKSKIMNNTNKIWTSFSHPSLYELGWCLNTNPAALLNAHRSRSTRHTEVFIFNRPLCKLFNWTLYHLKREWMSLFVRVYNVFIICTCHNNKYAASFESSIYPNILIIPHSGIEDWKTLANDHAGVTVEPRRRVS